MFIFIRTNRVDSYIKMYGLICEKREEKKTHGLYEKYKKENKLFSLMQTRDDLPT